MYAHGELLKRLRPLDEQELFFKELYLAKERRIDQDKYDAMLYNLHNSPDFYFCLKEDSILFSNLKSNIHISRHLRYSPMRGHSHTFFEMICVLEGSCQNFIEGSPLTLKAGDICIMSSNITHAMSVFDDSLIVNILIKKSTFKETFFELLKKDNALSDFFTRILYMDKASNYILFHTEGDIRIQTLLEFLIWDGLYEKKANPQLREYLLLAAFSYMLENHIDNIDLSDSTNDNSSKIVPLLQYIKKNYKAITLAELANRFNYAPNYLSNLIKEYTGYTFMQILTDTKLSNACKLLADTDIPVYEVASLVGYNNIEHFHRVFKKEMEVTPKEYRTKHKGEDIGANPQE